MPLPRVMAAPTGARRGKDQHPRLPLTVEEIARDAREIAAAGADALHLHIRDDEGRHSLDAGRYREAMAAVAEAAPGLAIQITTESAGLFSPADQLACLEAVGPEWATVCVREAMRDEPVARRIHALAAERGVRIQHILFGAADIALFRDALRRGVIPETHGREAIFVLGAYQPPRDGAPGDLAPLLDAAADLGLDWTVCAFGPGERACLAEALRRGGHVRVGFENNIHRPDGALAESNAAQVAEIVRIRAELAEAA